MNSNTSISADNGELLPLRHVSTRLVDRNPYWEYRHDRYITAKEEEADYWYAFTHGSVFVIARDHAGRYVLTRQVRYLNGRTSVEFPGGGLPAGANALEQAQRELKEETGYEAMRWSAIGEFNPMNGITNEICHVFLAEDLTQGEARPEATEQIEVVLLTKDEVQSMCAQNTIWDGMSLAAWMLLCSRT